MKKILLTILLFLATSSPAYAAISFATYSLEAFGNCTFSADAGSGTDRFLYVHTQAGVTDTVTAISFNGTAMTFAYKVQDVNGNWNYGYTLENPTSGSHSVVITNSGSCSFSLALGYAGVNQTGQPTAITANSGSGTSGSVTLSTAAANSWLVGYVTNTTNINTSSGGSTVRTRDSSTSLGDSTTDVGAAGSHSLAFAFNGSNASWNMYAFAIAPVGGGTTATPFQDIISFFSLF